MVSDRPSSRGFAFRYVLPPPLALPSKFSWKFQHLEGAGFSQKTADFRRKPQIVPGNRRKPLIGLRHLRCVTFSSALSWVRSPARDPTILAVKGTVAIKGIFDN